MRLATLNLNVTGWSWMNITIDWGHQDDNDGNGEAFHKELQKSDREALHEMTVQITKTPRKR